MTAVVRDARPPRAVIRILNPIMRTVLRTPAGRLVKPFALLEFRGRRSGRRYRVPVGWHDLRGEHLVLTPAAWRVNFRDGAEATVRYRGRRTSMTCTLVASPSEVAQAIDAIIDSGKSPGQIGLRVPPGHTVTADEVVAVDRKVIRFTA